MAPHPKLPRGCVTPQNNMSEFPSTRKLYKIYSGAKRRASRIENVTPQTKEQTEMAMRAVLTASTAANLMKPEAGNALLGFQQAPKKRSKPLARPRRSQRAEAVVAKYSEKLKPTATNSNTSFQWNRLQRDIATRVVTRAKTDNLLSNGLLFRDARRRNDDGTNYYA